MVSLQRPVWRSGEALGRAGWEGRAARPWAERDGRKAAASYRLHCVRCLVLPHSLLAMAFEESMRRPPQLNAAQLNQKKMRESYRKDLLQLAHEKKVERIRQLEGMLEAEERVDQKRLTRLLKDEEYERQMEEAIQKAEENKKLKELQLEQEERLATELARLNYEKLKDEKMRQQIRENSLELRELEKKLKSAYMNKERAVQIAEKEAIRYEKMKRDAEISQKMKEEQERVIMEESSAELRRNKEKILYQQELEKQLEEQEKKKQDAYEEFLKEKLMIDEIVRKIYEEDQMERQLKLEKMKATRRYIEEFKKEQAIWRRKKREEMEAENRKIIEFANMQQQREEDRMAKAQASEERKQKLQNMIAQNLEREQQEREDLEQVRQELYLEEQAEADRKREMAEMEKRIRQRLELRQTYEAQLAFKKIVLQALQEEEETFRQKMLAKFAEDDHIEQMNAQKRRMKQLEHRKAVEKLIEERHKQFLADKERELEERQLEERRQGNIHAIVEEERQKLLKEHATKLLGYLPRGILKDEEDVNMLGEEFRQAYQKRKEDVYSEDN
ncbi:meiosis-specific nuclear structural protein 1 isoform X1 [Dermochelys coriacea]|uniref:meiosis-specific nuclear structural protein 1 isoform X1 n=2 Tax=Dermochelys coriacea TaxID=27794 RepID=UPI001CA9F96D|nr:meiosis-specific nuclear structural protein 1 isoform X1 [Dermochelys coriacea]